jgi:hypothetical protein
MNHMYLSTLWQRGQIPVAVEPLPARGVVEEADTQRHVALLALYGGFLTAQLARSAQISSLRQV